MKDFIDIFMNILFILFIVYIMRGFFTSRLDNDEENKK